jgi:hypothetical protein
MKLSMNQAFKSDRRFQVVLAKVATHLQQQYPKQHTELNHSGHLKPYLDTQAEQAWEQVERAREAGYSPAQAEELAAPFLYPQIEGSCPRQEERDLEEIWLNDRLEKRVLDGTGKAVPFEQNEKKSRNS